MKTLKKLALLLLLAASTHSFAQETITSGRIHISITQNTNGISISSIKDNTTEVLNTGTNPDLFTLIIHDATTDSDFSIGATTGWTNVSLTNNGDNALIVLSNPTNGDLPDSLTATITLATDDEKSSWDLAVTGLGVNHSLMDSTFPHINIKADGNDRFLYPVYSGRITENPGTAIDYFDDAADTTDNIVGIYPRGWGTTMQFFSYYNANYGLYFGFHDPDASIKEFGIKNENGGIRIQCTIPAANKTINGNDWDMPGHFELDLYNGNWYDAALIYKEWGQNNASYWPTDSPERTTRQHKIGDIGIWLSSYLTDNTVPTMEGYYVTATDYYDVPVGLHIYQWNNKLHDHYYPNYFPEQTGFGSVVNNIQDNHNTTIMPYFNGRMWDTGIGQGTGAEADNTAEETAAENYFNTNGIASACKDSAGNVIMDHPYEDNEFAIMCPTQSPWQDILEDTADQLTSASRIHAKSIYIDMVAASPPVQCMDSNHGHSLGGGSYWRDGYKQMLINMHNTIPEEDFITLEGGCDFIADQADAFMVQGWQTRNQVPAWQAIYTGKVQLFGTVTGAGMYGDQRFYGRLSQGFIYGVQTGRQFISMGIDPNANPEKAMASNYTRELARMRYKLRDFMSYGEMKRPIEVTATGGVIPEITYTVNDWGGSHGIITITNEALRKTTWQNTNEVIVVFANGRIQSSPGTAGGNIDFTFDFDPNDYGLMGALTIQELTPTTDGAIEAVTATTFPKSVSLENLGLVAYKITADSVAAIAEEGTNTLMIYPNPSKDSFKINTTQTIEKVTIYNSLGQLVQTSKPSNNSVNIQSLSKGVYIINMYIQNNKAYTSRLIKK